MSGRSPDFSDTHAWSGRYCADCGDSKKLGRYRRCSEHPAPVTGDEVDMVWQFIVRYRAAVSATEPITARTVTVYVPQTAGRAQVILERLVELHRLERAPAHVEATVGVAYRELRR